VGADELIEAAIEYGEAMAQWPPLALRRFRPAIEVTKSFWKRIVQRSGPWRTTGEWWRPDSWDHDEWDVALSDGAIYRVHKDRVLDKWFVEGEYD